MSKFIYSSTFSITGSIINASLPFPDEIKYVYVEEFVSNNFGFIANQFTRLGSDISEEYFIELVDTYLISKPLPRKLYVKQDSYPVNSLSIEYHKEAYGIIVKQRPDDFGLPIIRPLKKDWLEFWAKLEKIGFWDLGDNYFDIDILDGFWGDVHITYKNKKKVIIINNDSTSLDHHAELCINEDICSIVKQIKI